MDAVPTLPPGRRAQLERALRSSTKYRHLPDSYFESDQGREHLEAQVIKRWQLCRRLIVPWVARKMKLDGAVMVDVGCGTGSSAAAFAPEVGVIHGYDIDPRALDAARRRFEVLEYDNLVTHDGSADKFAPAVRRAHPEGVDLVFIYAVMEHQKLHERLETLETWWTALKPGGLLIVADTPNRLVYRHNHTSHVPFFDMLPDALAFRIIDDSPKHAFRERMRRAIEESPELAHELLARWGRGVSFHEFQITLGDLRPLVVGDGFEAEILQRKKVVTVERLLLTFIQEEGLPIPIGFARRSLDIILRKPDGTSADRELRPVHDAEAVEPLPPMSEVRRLRDEIARLRRELESAASAR